VIALSTAWTAGRRPSLPRTFAAGRRMGFQTFEIGVSDAPFVLDDVLEALDEEQVTVCSLHAVCSQGDVPPPNRRGDWIAEPDEELRRQGVAAVRETIDIARTLGASAVVLHGGRLPLPDAHLMQLSLFRYVEMLAMRQATEEDANADGDAACPPPQPEQPWPPPLLNELVAQREAIVGQYLTALETSVRELCEYASDMRLALESRYYVQELPARDEFGMLFDRIDAPNLGYWHDIGHAHILERIGMIDHLAQLERYSDRLIGMHLHDIRGFRDHQPPGRGDFDFSLISKHLRPNVLRVMEIAPDLSARAIRRGREHLAKQYGID
jgi:sugar phosphate isomerase/epimerase